MKLEINKSYSITALIELVKNKLDRDFDDNGNDVQEMADYCWENVLYTTFGKKPETVAKQLTPTEKDIFEKVTLK